MPEIKRVQRPDTVNFPEASPRGAAQSAYALSGFGEQVSESSNRLYNILQELKNKQDEISAINDADTRITRAKRNIIDLQVSLERSSSKQEYLDNYNKGITAIREQAFSGDINARTAQHLNKSYNNLETESYASANRAADKIFVNTEQAKDIKSANEKLDMVKTGMYSPQDAIASRNVKIDAMVQGGLYDADTGERMKKEYKDLVYVELDRLEKKNLAKGEGKVRQDMVVDAEKTYTNLQSGLYDKDLTNLDGTVNEGVKGTLAKELDLAKRTQKEEFQKKEDKFIKDQINNEKSIIGEHTLKGDYTKALAALGDSVFMKKYAPDDVAQKEREIYAMSTRTGTVDPINSAAAVAEMERLIANPKADVKAISDKIVFNKNLDKGDKDRLLGALNRNYSAEIKRARGEAVDYLEGAINPSVATIAVGVPFKLPAQAINFKEAVWALDDWLNNELDLYANGKRGQVSAREITTKAKNLAIDYPFGRKEYRDARKELRGLKEE